MIVMADESRLAEDKKSIAPQQKEGFDRLMARLLSLEECQRLELLLLQRMKQRKPELQEMLRAMNDHWAYEDHFYRFYHGSFKVYGAQVTTERAVDLLRKLLPERQLNLMFEQIIREGTGQIFEYGHNKEWEQHTRPMLEAFSHAQFMIEMAVKYILICPLRPNRCPVAGQRCFICTT